MSSDKRVIVLIDMDCFYVQVEQRIHPEYNGKPCVVVQYKSWKGGSIVAVSYEAREFGINRRGFGDDAKMLCPDCHLFRIPEKRGKADLQRYRDAGAEVITALSDFTNWIEKASVDEAYIDITDLVRERGESANLRDEISDIHVATYKSKRGSKKWFDSDISRGDRDLAIGGVIAGEMRKHILEKTKFHCSAGVARNKSLAKLACGIRKPKGLTILPHSCVQDLFKEVPVDKLRNLGGKLGSKVIEKLDVKFMAEVYNMGLDKLRKILGEKDGDFVFAMSEGTYSEEVKKRQLSKSISCGKNFLGPDTLRTPDSVKHWLNQLALEIVERVTKDQQINKRKPLTITLYYKPVETRHGITRAAPFSVNCADRLTEICWLAMSRDKVPSRLLKGNSTEDNELCKAIGVSAITSLGLSACNFTQITENSIQNKLNFSVVNNDSNSTMLPTTSNIVEDTPEILEIDRSCHPALIGLKEDIDAQFALNFPNRGRDFKYTQRSSISNPLPKTDAAAFLESIPYANRVSISHLPTLIDHDYSSDEPEPFNYRTNVMLTARGIDVPTMHCLPLSLQEEILQHLADDARLNRNMSLKIEDFSSSSNSGFGFTAPKKEKSVKCVTCNESVLRSKLQEHKDSHLAHAIQDISEFSTSTPSLPKPSVSKKVKIEKTLKKGGRKKKPIVNTGQSTLNIFFNSNSNE
ncbi:DNA polymerase eta-like [Oopsacas minuta]|uniref:DNA polymerase eta n=1 Tax=Oopsacas minuta TaxID=111878 RepID=A0AAV7KDE2_9METZ|nr:DNA polymerase eta-like [Oopsacas minuta]